MRHGETGEYVREWVRLESMQFKARLEGALELAADKNKEIARLREEAKANEGTILALKNIGVRAKDRADTYQGTLEEAKKGYEELYNNDGAYDKIEEWTRKFAKEHADKIDIVLSPEKKTEENVAPEVCGTCNGSKEVYPGFCPRCDYLLREMSTGLWCEVCAVEFPKISQPCPDCK